MSTNTVEKEVKQETIKALRRMREYVVENPHQGCVESFLIVELDVRIERAERFL